LQQLSITLHFNAVHEKMMHSSWLIGSQAFTIGRKVDDAAYRSWSNGVSIKDHDVGDGANSQDTTVGETKQVGLYLSEFVHSIL
jgi:hypothetical protein